MEKTVKSGKRRASKKGGGERRTRARKEIKKRKGKSRVIRAWTAKRKNHRRARVGFRAEERVSTRFSAIKTAFAGSFSACRRACARARTFTRRIKALLSYERQRSAHGRKRNRKRKEWGFFVSLFLIVCLTGKLSS